MRVILATPFKNSNNNIVNVATAISPHENIDAYTCLLRNAITFDPSKNVLNNVSYTCFSDGRKGSGSALPALCPLTEDRPCLQHVLKNTPAVGKVCRCLPTWISSSFPFKLSWLTIFDVIFMKLLEHSDIVWADRAMIAEGGSTSRDQRTLTSRIMIFRVPKPPSLPLVFG